MDKIRLSVSGNFRNKENLAPMRRGKDGKESNQWAYGAFSNVIWTPEQIAQHVTSGRAICVSALREPHRKEENFLSSQMMGVDFDSGPDLAELLDSTLIFRHAFLLYRTPSYAPEAPRTRALFVLDEPMTSTTEYKLLLKRLLHHFDAADIDKQCKDAVRIFYGSTQPGAVVRPHLRLELDVLRQLPIHPDELPKPAPELRQVTAVTGSRAEAYANKARENILAHYTSTPAGQGQRHEMFNALCMQMIARAKGGWPGFLSVEQDLRIAGAQMGRDDDEINRAIKGAWAKADAMPLELPDNAEPVAAQTPPNGTEKIAQAAPPAPPAKPSVTWHDSRESLMEYKRRMRTAPEVGAVPLMFPYKVLWEAGGFCRAVMPGIMMSVSGLSGGLKTSFVETITDRWRQVGPNHILWWGPEWDWKHMSDRAVQRYSHLGMTEMMLHEMWLAEEAANVPKNKRFGVRQSDNILSHADAEIDKIAAWPGLNFYMEEMDIDIDNLIEAYHAKADDCASQGEPIRIAVFDYVQLINMRSVRSESERITQVLGLIKSFCVERKVIGVIASQVVKASGKAVRDGSQTLDAESGQFQRSDKFNLVLTLNPIYQGELLTDKAIIRVAKNSAGMNGLMKCVRTNPARFLWMDEELPMPNLKQNQSDGDEPYVEF